LAGRRRPSDEELIALTDEYGDRRTYRPGDEVAEPEKPPEGPAGTSTTDDDASSAGN
jgi:hypothetical protein